MNTDFVATSEAIRQWFSRVMKSRVKIIVDLAHDWQNVRIHDNPYNIFITYTLYYALA